MKESHAPLSALFSRSPKGGPVMIVTTTKTIENHSITDYLGLVAGESILEAKEVLAGIADHKAENYETYKVKMTKARLFAVEQMKTKAEKMEADAIVAIDFDYVALPDNSLMVAASGTAVKLSEQSLSM